MAPTTEPRGPRARSRLVVKVALAFLAVGVSPIVALGLVTGAQLSAQIEADARARHVEVADEARRLVDVWVRGVQTGLGELAIAIEREVAAERAASGRNSAPLVDQVQRAVPQAWSANSEVDNFEVWSNSAVDNRAQLDGAVDGRSNRIDVDESRARSRSGSRLVNDAIAKSCAVVGDELELGDDGLVIPMSVPLSIPEDLAPGGSAAIVGDVDTSEIVSLLRALAGERYGLRVSDAAGVALVDTFPPNWRRAAWVTTRSAGAGRDWSVLVGRPADVLAAPVESLRRRTLLATAVAAVLALVLSVLLSVRITRPVAVLEARARALSAGDLSARTGLARDDEIGRLSEAFDRMAASLEQLDDARSAFVATVSHELRTPLTSLRLGVANLEDGVHGEVGSDQRRALERVRREVVGLEAIVEDLLALTRLEAGAAPPRLESVDLAAVVARVVDAMRRESERRDVSIECAGAARVHTDARLVERALANLVHNGVKHTPGGGRVTIALESDRVHVLDEGPGWPASFADPSEATAAFARGAASEGHGLGLAIAERIARAVGARLELGDRGDSTSGARASLVFSGADAERASGWGGGA